MGLGLRKNKSPSVMVTAPESLHTKSASAQLDLSVIEANATTTADDALLMELGYKPELKRNFSMIEVFGIAFSIMSLLPSIASTLAFNMPGGPTGMTWGWLVPSLCIMTVAVAMSELGSAMPTSGGLYWWTYRFAPGKAKRPLCFLAGYANTLGLIAGILSIDWGFATMLLSVVAIADETFEPTKYTTYGIFVACVFTHLIIGSTATKMIARLQAVCIYLNMTIIVITLIALPVGNKVNGKPINSGKYVFATVENYTNWPDGWAFFMSFLSCTWTISAFDSCIHMSEEASNAAKAVPFGMCASVGLCGLLGFVIMAVITACISTDIPSILGGKLGQPMAEIYMNSLGKKWTIAMMCMIFVVQWFMGLSITIAASRQTWAFSRDDALPFSKFLKVVNEKWGVPQRAVLFDCIVALLLGCIGLANDAAIQALFSLGPASNAMAWVLPIACRHIWFEKDAFKPGPFYLGHKISRINGLFAAFYLTFVICTLCQFPAVGPHVNAETMNYTCVINGAVWGGSLLYYFVHARKWFEGPVTNVQQQYMDGMEGPAGTDAFFDEKAQMAVEQVETHNEEGEEQDNEKDIYNENSEHKAAR